MSPIIKRYIKSNVKMNENKYKIYTYILTIHSRTTTTWLYFQKYCLNKFYKFLFTAEQPFDNHIRLIRYCSRIMNGLIVM